MDDRDLLRLHADTLFTYDTHGRMLRTNEPRAAARRPAPRLFLGRTTTGVITRVGATVPETVARRLEEIIDRLPPLSDRDAPPADLAAVREVLEHHAPITDERHGPAYRFPAVVMPPGEAVPLTAANVAMARDTYPWLLDELADWGPCVAILRDGAAVSVCFSSRMGAAAAEAGVDTVPAFRGQGYATAVTTAWGAAIRALDRIPLYSTGWDNGASRGVARRAGLIMVGADATWT